MPDKRKLHFWQLVFVFGAITILALAANYGYGSMKQPGMMNDTMGSMMGLMHLKNITVSDLVKQQERLESIQGQAQTQNHSNHHATSGSFLKTAHYLTTAAVILLLPFIIAGSIFLAIVWIK
ncbi:MAG: hypothetical protein N3B21_13920 [Clostridia bacterium]|nr:hypothetical protein [Clostridia bacterium]